MRRICLIRHARPLDEGFRTDHARTLSEEGKKIHERVTLELQKKGVAPDRILSSPKVRAVETAEIMGRIYQVPVVTEELLNGRFSPYLVLPLLQTTLEGETLFVITHMPLIVELATLLAYEEPPHSFPQSSMALYEFSDGVEQGGGRLQLYLKS